VLLPRLLAGAAEVPSNARRLSVSDLAFDSRRAKSGYLFFGLPGLNAHGAAFASQARASGAVAMVTDAAGAALADLSDWPVIVVDNPRAVMAAAAVRLFGDPTARRTTFGVTGTAGKTTTSLMLDAALRANGRHSGYIGSIGFTVDGRRIPMQRSTPTTPESIDLQAMLAAMAEQGADSFVMEATSVGLELDRLAGVSFDVVGFTNLGRDHMDYHHTVENYFAAKTRLFRPGWAGHAVVNLDDPYGQRLLAMMRQAGDPPVTTVGYDAAADFRIVGRTVMASHQQVVFEHDGQTAQFDLDMPGEFNVRNAMLALAMMDAAGFDQQTTLQGLAHATAPGRMQRVDLGEGAPLVFVDDAHTPEATEAALKAATRPMIAVVGCGGDRDHGKRALTGAACARQADVVIVTDDNPRTEDPAAIRAAIRQGAVETGLCDKVLDGGGRQDAIKQALAMAEPGWTVVVLGRGDEDFQEVHGQLIPLHDVDVVQTAWHELTKP